MRNKYLILSFFIWLNWIIIYLILSHLTKLAFLIFWIGNIPIFILFFQAGKKDEEEDK